MREETPEQLSRWLRQTSHRLPVIAACFICLALWEFETTLHVSPTVRSTLFGVALTMLMGNTIIFLYARYRLRTNRKTTE